MYVENLGCGLSKEFCLRKRYVEVLGQFSASFIRISLLVGSDFHGPFV